MDGVFAEPKTDAAGNATLHLFAAESYLVTIGNGKRSVEVPFTSRDTSVEAVVPAK